MLRSVGCLLLCLVALCRAQTYQLTYVDKPLSFGLSDFSVTAFSATLTDEAAVLDGYFCPAYSLSAPTAALVGSCADACDYAAAGGCGLLAPLPAAAASAVLGSCPACLGRLDTAGDAGASFSRDLCEQGSWVDLAAAAGGERAFTAPARLSAGYSVEYRLYLSDLRRGLAVRFELRSGQLHAAGGLLLYDAARLSLDSFRGAAVWLLCPGDLQPANSSQTAAYSTFSFRLFADEDTEFTLSYALVDPLPVVGPVALASLPAPLVPLRDAVAVQCAGAACGAVVFALDAEQFLPAAADDCGSLVLAVRSLQPGMTSLPHAQLLLAEQPDALSQQRALIQHPAGQPLALSLCRGDVLYAALWQPPDAPPVPLALTATSAAVVERLPLSSLNFYSAATAHLLNTLTLHCPDPASNATLVYRCSSFDPAGCPFFVPSLGQQQPLAWPPLPRFAASNRINWSQQASDLIYAGFNFTAQFRRASFQWTAWNWQASDPASRQQLRPLGYALSACRWRFTPRLVRSAASDEQLGPLPAVNASNRRPLHCSAERFHVYVAEQLAPSLMSLTAPNLDSTGIRKVMYALAMLAYADDFAACRLLTDSLLQPSAASTQKSVDSAFCLRSVDDPLYNSDPCCSNAAALTQCCAPRAVPTRAAFALQANASAVAATCQTSVACASSFLDEYAQLSAGIYDQFSCLSLLKASVASQAVALQALQQCSGYAFSDDQSQPWRCLTDNDCPAGVACDQRQRRCALDRRAMEQRYVDCLFGARSPLSLFVVEAMAARVNSSAPPGSQQFVADVAAAFAGSACVTDDDISVGSRSHWQLQRTDAQCRDACSDGHENSADGPFVCLDRSCLLPVECRAGLRSCTAQWTFVNLTRGVCQSVTQRCNWRDEQACGDEACQQACLARRPFCGYCTEQGACYPVLDDNAQLCDSVQVCLYPGGVVSVQPRNATCPPACSLPCRSAAATPQCRSSSDSLAAVCWSPLTPQQPCLAGGVAVGDVCVYPAAQTWYACTTYAPGANTSWATCQQLSAAQCSGQLPTGRPPRVDSLLGCLLTDDEGPCPDRQTCAATGTCSDRAALINRLTVPSTYGACVTPYAPDPLRRCQGPSVVPTLVGCADWSVSRAACPARGGRWLEPVALGDAAGCAAYTGCSDLTLKNASACQQCGSFVEPAFAYAAGAWVQPTVVLPSIVQPAVVSTHSWSSALDVDLLSRTVQQLIETDIASSEAAAALCTMVPLLPVFAGVSCACSGFAEPQRCLEQYRVTSRADLVNGLSGTGLPCPYRRSIVAAPPATFFYDVDSVPPAAGCQSTLVSTVSYLHFLAPLPPPPSSLFTRTRARRDFEFVNAAGVPVGQVVGDGAAFIGALRPSHGAAHGGIRLPVLELDRPFVQNYSVVLAAPSTPVFSARAANVLLCVEVQTALLDGVAARYSVLDFARLSADTTNLVPLRLNGTYVTSDGGSVCALVNIDDDNDSFVPVVRVAQPEAQQQPLFEPWELGIIYATSALYLATVLAMLGRLLHIAHLGLLFTNQSVFPLCLLVFDVLRGVYFALLGAEQLTDLSEAANFALIDLPYFFFILGMTLLLFWWLSLAFTAERSHVLRNFRLLMLSTAVVLAALLAVVGGLYALLSDTKAGSTCGGRVKTDSSGLSDAQILLIVYKSFLCLLVVLGGVGFALAGMKIRTLTRHSLERKVTYVTVIAVASFIGQSVYFILIVVVPGMSDSAYTLIPLWFIEIVPQWFMLYFQRPAAASSRSGGTSATNSPRDRTPSDRSSVNAIQASSAASEQSFAFDQQIYRGEDE